MRLIRAIHIKECTTELTKFELLAIRDEGDTDPDLKQLADGRGGLSGSVE